MSDFCCPITHQPMRDPVVTSDGQSYERSAIERWILLRRRKKLPVTSPLTGLRLEHTKLTPNIALRNVNENIQRKRKFDEGSSSEPNKKKPKTLEYEQALTLHSDTRDEEGVLFTPLGAAIYAKDEESAEALLDGGADPNEVDGDGRNALIVAAWKGCRLPLFRRILGMIHNVNAGIHDGRTALMIAADWNHLDMVVSLMRDAKQPIDVNVQCRHHNFTALHHAVSKNSPAIVAQLLRDERVDTSLKDQSNRTPLKVAIEFKHDECEKILRKHEQARKKAEAQALLVLSIFSRHFSEFAKWIKKQFVTNTRLTTLDSFVWKDDKTVEYKITAYGQEIKGTMGVVKNHNAGYQDLPKTQVLYKQHLCKLIPYVNGQNVIALAQSLSDEVKDKLRRAVREEVNKCSFRISSEAGSVCYWLRERKTNYRRCVSFYHKVKNWIRLNLKDNTEMSSGVLRWETTVTKLFVPRRQEKRTLTKGDEITEQTFKDLLRLHPRGTFNYTPEALTYFGEGWSLLSDGDVKEAYDDALMKMEEKLNEVICEKTANDEAVLESRH